MDLTAVGSNSLSLGNGTQQKGVRILMLAQHVGALRSLIEVVESDDVALASRTDVVWYEGLRAFDYREWLHVAAQYYEALWGFNIEQARKAEAKGSLPPNEENKGLATLRLIGERASESKSTPSLFDQPPADRRLEHVDINEIRPGVTPLRFAGRQPKCFFAMFKAFLAMTLRGIPPEPERVHEELVSNPAFARACGFSLPASDGSYRQSDFPSLRKVQQFDQIMADNGLWGAARKSKVVKNFETGIIKPEGVVVHDTTHYTAYSGMTVIELPQPDGSKTEPEVKSHPKTTKNCRCKQRDQCPHPWISADEGAGTVVKGGGKKYWAHKASTMALPGQGILLDAVAMADGASHDSKSVVPHLSRLFGLYPVLEETVTRVLDDAAADDVALKDEVQKDFGVELLTGMNPRGRKPLTKDLPRGIDRVTATGTPVCQAGIPFDFLGCRHEPRMFIFRAPRDESGKPVCLDCPLKDGCYRGQDEGRTVTIPFDRLPWIDPQFPQLSRRFQKVMALRTAIERMHKLMKYDYGDERLSKRGNSAFQARLDKTLLAMHVALALG
jgi:hypothetical protein